MILPLGGTFRRNFAYRFFLFRSSLHILFKRTNEFQRSLDQMYVRMALQEIQCEEDHTAVISNNAGVMRRRFRFCPHPSFQHANAAGNERRLRLRHQPLLPPPRGSDIAASSSSFSSSSSRSFPCLISLLPPPTEEMEKEGKRNVP